VLLMGPLYHLLEHGQRVRAIRQVRRVLRPGGNVFAAFVMRNSIVQYGLARQVDYVVACKAELEAILSTGTCSPSHSKDGTSSQPRGEQRINHFWMAAPSEIEPLMSEGGFDKADLVHCEALAFELEANINAAPDELHQEWIDLLYRLSRDPSIMGGGGHIMYVGRKPRD